MQLCDERKSYGGVVIAYRNVILRYANRIRGAVNMAGLRICILQFTMHSLLMIERDVEFIVVL